MCYCELHFTALHCTVLHCTALQLHCTVLLLYCACRALHFYTVLCCMMPCYIVLYYAALFCPLWNCDVLYCAMLHDTAGCCAVFSACPYIVLCCAELRSMVRGYMVLNVALLCYAARWCAVLYGIVIMLSCIVQCSTAQHSTAQHMSFDMAWHDII